MKSVMYKILSLVLLVVAAGCLIAAFTVKGGGFIDMTDIVKYFFIGLAVLSGIVSLALLIAAKKKAVK